MTWLWASALSRGFRVDMMHNWRRTTQRQIYGVSVVRRNYTPLGEMQSRWMIRMWDQQCLSWLSVDLDSISRQCMLSRDAGKRYAPGLWWAVILSITYDRQYMLENIMWRSSVLACAAGLVAMGALHWYTVLCYSTRASEQGRRRTSWSLKTDCRAIVFRYILVSAFMRILKEMNENRLIILCQIDEVRKKEYREWILQNSML